LHHALAIKEKGYTPHTRHLNTDGSPVYTNRLILETSPYLLQHAHNPVNWYAWGDDAFEAAKRLDRPILLSVGYSTCHWCHVMERESFEDQEIASFINSHFIPIKVDREERPDIDAVYMDAVRMLSGGGGGWPMTVIMTADRRPFFGGTYFPARDGDRGAHSGFLTILRYFADQYANNRQALLDRAKETTQRIEASAGPQPAAGIPGSKAFDLGVRQLQGNFDATDGGFGHAPKFPRSVIIDFLLRYYRRTGDQRALDMATVTLERMAAGGIHDQIGGGFHRYSTDSKWLVPHFEKMLYDNAQLAEAYLEAYQVTDRSDFAEVARTTLDYVLREMTDPEGGFYSATDADSPTPDGKQQEGWFFTWTPAEILAVVGEKRARIIDETYGVSEAGNFEGRNILYVAQPLPEAAKALGMSVEDLSSQLRKAREQLYRARELRPPPHKDTKVITAWNGLMISALSKGARILGEPRYAEAARRAAVFIKTNMKTGDRLRRSWREGEAKHDAVLDDYAFLAAGLLDLYETTHETRWLSEAIALHIELRDKFWDRKAGGFYFTASDAEALLSREKPYYDGAEPSGNAVAAINLLRLYEFTTNEGYRDMAEQALKTFGRYMERAPTAVPQMMGALDFYLDEAKEIVIVSKSPGEGVKPFMKSLAERYLPNCAVVVTSEGKQAEQLEHLVPLVEGKVAIDGDTTAYVCEKHVCKLPTKDPEVFAGQIATVSPLSN